MEVKKSSHADLENRKSVFLLMGFIFALSIVYVGFEWSTEVVRESLISDNIVNVSEEEIIPITKQEVYMPPPPPPDKAVELVEKINIVENQQDVKAVDIRSTEDDPSKDVDFQKYGTGESTGSGSKYGVYMREEAPEDNTIFTVVEEMPEFPGGETALFAYLSKNIRYPDNAMMNGIQGLVICTFVVNANGKVTEAKIIRGVDRELDAEALRVVNTMPLWKPGKQRGKPVRVRFTLPIHFRVN